MASFITVVRSVSLLAMLLLVALPAQGQVRSPCTPAMVSSFSPCMNFLTNSTANRTLQPSPTPDCCNSLRSAASNGISCLCLILTAGVPFQIPGNRTLAISLPRACNMPGVPLQCNASASPIPAPSPGPVLPGRTLPSGPAPSPSTSASSVPEPNASPNPAPGSSPVPAVTPAPPLRVASESPAASPGRGLPAPPPAVVSESPNTTSGRGPSSTPSASAAASAACVCMLRCLALLLGTSVVNCF